MALKAIVTSLDEIPEALREHYTQSGDKYVLNAEGMVPKTKLDEFRTNNIALQAKLDELKDVDPAEYRKLKAEITKAKEEAARGDPAKLEELLNERVTSMKSTFEKQVGDLTTTNQTLSRKLEVVLVDNALQAAAVEAGVMETALEDVVRRGRDVFRLKDDKVLPFKGDQMQYGADGVTPLTMKEWLAGLAGNAPHLFKGSKGGGAENGGRGGKGPAIDPKLPPSERLKLARRGAAK